MADDRMGYISEMSEMPEDENENSALLAGGGAVIELDDDEIADFDNLEETKTLSDKFDANLAEDMESPDLNRIGNDLRQFYDADIESRAPWEQRMNRGMEIIGLEDIPEDSAAFDGAAQVTHPALAEAMVQFQARAMEEMLPPEGPVKGVALGKQNPQLEAQAKRVQDALNYQLTEGDDQYYWDTDSMLFYLPYAGSAFKKVAIDPITGMTRSRFVRGVDMVVPYSATSLQDAPRYTHRYTMTRNNYLRAVDRGHFMEVDLPAGQSLNSGSVTEGREMADKADDRQQSFSDNDEIYTFLETHIELELKDDPYCKGKKYKLPYVVTWEMDSMQIVRIQRCWHPEDESCKKLVWFVHEKYLPGFGFYGFGLLHLIGSLGRAAGGALRALLDGSHTASLQGGFKTRDARMSGEMRIEPGVWKDVDLSAEELAKAFYTPPFKEPSPALFKTLEIIVNGIQRFASTTEAMVGDANNTGPVGTTVALIEQGSKIFSGIHRRLHLAARQEFKLIALSNYLYMSGDSYEYEANGELHEVSREDFDSKVDIVPVSDPNIFSSVQRIALAQALTQDVDANPDIYDTKAKRRAHRAMLVALKVPNAESYLPENDIERRSDPITENQHMLAMGAARAFADQDHAAHMTIHANFMQEVMGMGDPDVINKIVPILKAHIAEHFGWSYRLRIQQELMDKTGIPLPPYDPDDDNAESLPIDVENAVAAAVAQYIAPPPPAQPANASEEDAKDMAMQRDQDRKDVAFEKDQQRADAKHMLELKREGLVDDSDLQGSPPI